MSITTQDAPAERKACSHDSTRLDGLLDTCCLKCGADGYWQDGQRRVSGEGVAHPGGKILLRPEAAA